MFFSPASYLLLYFIAIFPKFVATKDIKWLVLIWGIVAAFIGLANGAPLIPLIILLIAKSPFLYFWLRLLDANEDTLFLYIIIVLGGGILVDLAGGLVGGFAISLLD